jgi:transcriptional regulator NrdR family protein
MKCPHCDKESKATVIESRRAQGAVWRRRTCLLCYKNFVSQEVTSPSMKFPREVQSRGRKTDRTLKPEQKAEVTGLHLQKVWS